MPLKLVEDGHYDAEAFAHEFARRHKRRVKRYSTLGAGGAEERYAVSVRAAGHLTKRIFCDPEAVIGDIDRSLPRGMACSVGAVWPPFTHESRFRAGRKGDSAVFITSHDSERVPELLQAPAFSSALDASELAAGECLQTVSGIGFLFLQPTQERVEVVFGLLERLSDAFQTKVPGALPPRYPGALRPISSLVMEWGIVDAAVREQRVADAHPDALRRMMGSARHYAEKIETFLARTRYPDSDAAQTIRAFVQAVALAEKRMQNVESLPMQREHR